jgi:hypothetical protein
MIGRRQSVRKAMALQKFIEAVSVGGTSYTTDEKIVGN